MPHSARSAELTEPSAGSPAGRARSGSQMAGGVPEGAQEPARLQAGQLSRREPGELAGLAITGAGKPVMIRASQAVVMQAARPRRG